MAEAVDVLLKEIPKNSNDVVRVALSHINGHDGINIRIFHQYQEGEWGPTKKGIWLPIRIAGEVAETILEALTQGEGT